MTTQLTVSAKEEAKQQLLDLLDGQENKRIYSIVTKVSKSGMSRRIKFYTIKDNELYQVTYIFSKLLQENLNDDGVRRVGCGMDMCFDAVYTVSRMLYGNGYDIESRNIG